MIEVWKFYSPSCGPCRVAGTALSKLADDLAGQPVQFKSIDVMDEGKDLAAQLEITTIPVVIIKNERGEEAARFVGCKRYSEYRNAVEEALGV